MDKNMSGAESARGTPLQQPNRGAVARSSRGHGRGLYPQPSDERPEQGAWRVQGASHGPQRAWRGQGSSRGPQGAWRGRGASRGPQGAWRWRGASRGPQGAWRGRGASRGPQGAGDQRGDSASAAQGPGPSKRAPTPEAPAPNQPAGALAVRDVNRGAVRGKRVIEEVVHSRPSNTVTKIGYSGRKITVKTNYFLVLKKPEWTIHQYRIDFAPDVDLMSARRYYLAQYKHLFGGYLFNGTEIFSATYLGDKLTNGQLELITKNKDGDPVQIKIKHVGTVETGDKQQLQVLNIMLRRCLEGLQLQLVGRNFFDEKAKINLDSYHMQIWPGYQTSIRQHEQDILLCVDIAHKVMRTDSLYHILSVCIRESADYQTAFKREVVGMIILTDYNNKTYRVDDVDFNTSPLTSFSTKTGNVTFVEYYKERYHIDIRDKKQPMIVSRPTRKDIRGGRSELILLVPELCRATGLTDAMRSNMRLMKAMGEHTRLVPERRINRLRSFNSRLQTSKPCVDVLKLWDVELDKQLVEVPARELPLQKIIFTKDITYECDTRADWTRELRNKPMFAFNHIQRWYVIVPRRSVREVQDFISKCIRAAAGMNMKITQPRYEELPDDRSASYSIAIDNVTAQDPQIVMAVLVNHNEEKYSCIKKKCCVDRPVPSQVVTLRTIAPRGDKAAGLMSVATKVVIQMNVKLGGAPWMIQLPLTGLMTVGFDVCHSGKDKNSSFGALVATMDLNSTTRYYSAVIKHTKGEEMSSQISMKLAYALRKYKETHHSLPSKLIFYRDGVGDGQLHQVVNIELDAIRQKLDEIYKSCGIQTGCPLAFVVVSKRINTRFFTNGKNPIPGTVVDDIITLPERYDFYLVSQSVHQGTASPTSYNVIYDNMGLDADKVQQLTYKMTHMYYNWSGTCRVPAVCQYAHKLAFLVGESIFREPSNALENLLYFL